MPQTLKRKGNLENNKSAVQLYEIGPRMTMQLMKIEEGLLTGEVLYHDHIVKTEEEKEELRKMIEKKQKLKEQRKKQQAENRAKKLKELEKKNKGQKSSAPEGQAEGEEEINENLSDLEDDAVYYKEEVGEEPDEELFKNTEPASRKRPKLPYSLKNNKKQKLDKESSSSSAGKNKDFKDKKNFKDKKGFKNGFKEKKSFKFNKKK